MATALTGTGPGARPSAVTARELARATATRQQRGARLKVWAGSVCTALVVLPVVLAGLLPLPDANAQNLAGRRLPPLADGHLFGTDQLGRDLLSRILHGGQVSLTVGVLAVVVSGLIGVVAGSAAGYFGGWTDAVVSRLLEAQLALPLLMMLLLVVALFGASVTVITCVIAIAQWPEVARLTRSLVLVEREKPYVAAARVLGLRGWSILGRHVIPNIVRPASLVILLLLAQAVLLESALSFLGAGPQRPFATWGRIISDGQDYLTTSWWLVTLPGLVIALLVVGVNLLGDGLRDHTRPQKGA
ncbi:ABC transporter permease [Streptomyces sp. NPDC017993]|uniref:ABC transporter permease n=1 Tax=Streptomyces sp. NPDC017993 TaxID=3365027 RepID=UPI00378DDB10